MCIITIYRSNKIVLMKQLTLNLMYDILDRIYCYNLAAQDTSDGPEWIENNAYNLATEDTGDDSERIENIAYNLATEDTGGRS
jgi:hypothetical protein